MAKIIQMKPIIIHNCKKCPFSYMDFRSDGIFKPNKEIYFCTAATYNLNDVKGKMPIHPATQDHSRSYVFLENLYEIPSWCPLEEYKE